VGAVIAGWVFTMYPYAHSRAVSAPCQEVPRQLTKHANEIAGICTWERYMQ
jgi:hypothetical protein